MDGMGNKGMQKFMLIDTETAPTVKRENTVPYEMRVYDIGIIIADMSGAVYYRGSFIITDTFFNDYLMNSAYYADKLPQYRNGIYTLWQPITFLRAYTLIRKLINTYDIHDIWAFNVRFDEQALNATIRDYSNGYVRFFFPYGVKLHDIWDYAGNVITNTKKYVQWCIANNFINETGNPSTNAETIYCYLTDDTTFTEKHTALRDCEIELFILLKCHIRHGKRPKKRGQGWRPAAKIAKAMDQSNDE